jgi:hypothetical protein
MHSLAVRLIPDPGLEEHQSWDSHHRLVYFKPLYQILPEVSASLDPRFYNSPFSTDQLPFKTSLDHYFPSVLTQAPKSGYFSRLG